MPSSPSVSITDCTVPPCSASAAGTMHIANPLDWMLYQSLVERVVHVIMLARIDVLQMEMLKLLNMPHNKQMQSLLRTARFACIPRTWAEVDGWTCLKVCLIMAIMSYRQLVRALETLLGWCHDTYMSPSGDCALQFVHILASCNTALSVCSTFALMHRKIIVWALGTRTCGISMSSDGILHASGRVCCDHFVGFQSQTTTYHIINNKDHPSRDDNACLRSSMGAPVNMWYTTASLGKCHFTDYDSFMCLHDFVEWLTPRAILFACILGSVSMLRRRHRRRSVIDYVAACLYVIAVFGIGGLLCAEGLHNFNIVHVCE